MWSPLWSILVCKIPQFWAKAWTIWTAHQNVLESRHPEVTKSPYYALSPEGSQKMYHGLMDYMLFQYTIYCSIYQHLTMRFTLHSVKHKQITSGKDKWLVKFKTFYIHVLKTPENPWNNPNKGVKLLTCKGSSSNSSSISCCFSVQNFIKYFFKILMNLLQSFLSILF